MGKLLPAAGMGAVIAAAILVAQHPAAADPVNHCPTGCVESDLSTVVTINVKTRETRAPMLVATPANKGPHAPGVPSRVAPSSPATTPAPPTSAAPPT